MPAVLYFIYFIIFPVIPGGGYPTGTLWVSLEKKIEKKKRKKKQLQTMGFAECKCPQARAFPK
jgi:hypothetical protein